MAWDLDAAYLTDMTADEMYEQYMQLETETEYVYLKPFEFYGMSEDEAGVSAIKSVEIENRESDYPVAEYTLSESKYAVTAALYANCSVNDLKFYELMFDSFTDDGRIIYVAGEIDCHGDFEAGEEINISIVLPEMTSNVAVGYIDDDGTVKYFAVSMSGEDGSLFFTQLTDN